MAPAMVLVLSGMYDLASAWITSRRITTAVYSVGQIATTLSPQPDNSNALSYTDAWRASTAAYAAMPQLLAPGAVYSVTLTQVVFGENTSCPKGTCEARVKWSKTFLGTGAARLCGVLNHVSDTTPASMATLPEDAFQAQPALLVDLSYTYNPLFLKTLIGPIPMHETAIFPVRIGNTNDLQTIKYVDAGAQCS